MMAKTFYYSLLAGVMMLSAQAAYASTNTNLQHVSYKTNTVLPGARPVMRMMTMRNEECADRFIVAAHQADVLIGHAKGLISANRWSSAKYPAKVTSRVQVGQKDGAVVTNIAVSAMHGKKMKETPVGQTQTFSSAQLCSDMMYEADGVAALLSNGLTSYNRTILYTDTKKKSS